MKQSGSIRRWATLNDLPENLLGFALDKAILSVIGNVDIDDLKYTGDEVYGGTRYFEVQKDGAAIATVEIVKQKGRYSINVKEISNE